MKTKSSNDHETKPMAYDALLCLVLSDKGKNWIGEKLTEDNLNANVMVKWRRDFYKTGNRYHTKVELYDSDNKFIRTVSTNHICSVCPAERR